MIADRRDLFVFGGFTDDAQGVLAAVHRFALVGFKLRLDVVSASEREAGFELSIAALAYSDDRRRGFLDDPEFALLHDRSLAHLADGR